MGLNGEDDHNNNGLAALLQPEGKKSHILARKAAAPNENQFAYDSTVQHVLDLSPTDSAFAHKKGGPLNIIQIIENKISDIQSQHHDTPHVPAGRLGPLEVGLDPNSIAGSFTYGTHDLCLESLTNFSSCRGGVCVYQGKWMFEVTLNTAGIQQVGWATIHCPFTAEEGVGDAPDSYAYDGKRLRKWSESSAAYGEQWAPGDVIGCCIDLDDRTISFHRNGTNMGVAFSNVRTMQPHLAYFPAVSLSHAERCELNFGAQPLQYPVPGYTPLQPPPPPPATATCSYLADCLLRLLRLTHQQHPQPGRIAWHDTVILAAALLQKLQPFYSQEYFVASSLLPLLLSCHGSAPPHRPSTIHKLLQLLHLAWHPSTFTASISSLLLLLSSRCKSAPLRPQELPHSGSYPLLALLNCMLQVPAVKALWLEHHHFYLMTEGFLTRKSPTPDDLQQLLPHVWWRGCAEPGCSEQRYQQCVQQLGSAVEAVDEQQLLLLAQLLGCPSPDAPDSDAFMEFVRYMLQKNAGAARDVPPPGLSEQTVIISLYFILQRLLLPHMAAAAASSSSSSSPLRSFPAHELFVQSHSSELHPLHDAPRVGGIMSHLLREVVVAQQHRGAVTVQVPLPPPASDAAAEAAAGRVQAEWLPELLNALLMLYSWRAGSSLKTIGAVSQAVTNSIASLEDADRSIRQLQQQWVQQQEREGGAAAAPAAAAPVPAHLQEARSVFLQEAAANVRVLALLNAVLTTGSKQRLLFSHSAYLAALLHSAAASHGNLLGYAPTFYAECVIESMSALRRAESVGQLFAPVQLLQQHGLGAPVALLVTLLNDSRVANPDVKESLLQCVSSLLASSSFMWAFEHSEAARSQLVPAAMAVFDSRLWHPASQVLLRLVRGAGFGEPGFAPAAGSSVAQLSTFQAIMRASCQPHLAPSRSFLHKLFNMVNWGLTELTVAAGEVASQRSLRRLGELQSQLRRTSIMFDLSVSLLRILEFVVVQVPNAFLPSASKVNLSRVMELLGFVLSHFTVGPDARRINELIQTHSRASAAAAAAAGGAPPSRMQQRQQLDKVSKAEVLAPAMGMLLGLVQQGGPLVGQLVACADARMPEYLQFMKDLDWCAAYPAVPLSGQLRLFEQLLREYGAAREAAAAAAQQVAALAAEVPDEFLDPITMTLMQEPVVLPDSQVTVDRSTIERHLLSAGTDPFSRAELRIDMVRPDEGMGRRIREWLQQQQQQQQQRAGG